MVIAFLISLPDSFCAAFSRTRVCERSTMEMKSTLITRATIFETPTYIVPSSLSFTIKQQFSASTANRGCKNIRKLIRGIDNSHDIPSKVPFPI